MAVSICLLCCEAYKLVWFHVFANQIRNFSSDCWSL
jgi:hypothetical protein